MSQSERKMQGLRSCLCWAILYAACSETAMLKQLNASAQSFQGLEVQTLVQGSRWRVQWTSNFEQGQNWIADWQTVCAWRVQAFGIEVWDYPILLWSVEMERP